jgi:hypothetical protein
MHLANRMRDALHRITTPAESRWVTSREHTRVTSRERRIQGGLGQKMLRGRLAAEIAAA